MSTAPQSKPPQPQQQAQKPAPKKPGPKKPVKNTMKGKGPVAKFADSLQQMLAMIANNPLMYGLAGIAVILLALFFIGLGIISPSSSGKQIQFSQATSLIKTPQALNHVTILDQDARLELTTANGQQYWTAYPQSNAYTSQVLVLLQDHNVPTAVDPQSGKVTFRYVVQFLLPILILVTLFGLITLMAREQGGMIAAFSKWTGKKEKGGTKQFSFGDVAGAPEALIELGELVDYLENPQRYADLGARAPKGVLLVGPPGTGKTLLARAVAGEAKANFFSISGSEFVESLVGVGAARVRDLFKQARDAAPAIIFIDELDAVGRQRGAGMGQGHDEREQTLNQMLVEMDGFGAEAGVVVMAATNRPDILDNALLRPGRFDRQVVVDLPDVHGRAEILALHASKAPVSRNADMMRIAHQTPGFSGADLANLINEASLLAVRAHKREVEQAELEEAIDRVLMGPARKSHLLTPEELWRIAVHESGHAIVAKAIDMPAALQKLSVVARGRGRGGATLYASSDQLLLTELELRKQLVTTMGGAAAESFVFGMLSTGVDGDIDQATKIAHSMAAVYGMSPAIGPVAVGEKEGQVFIGRDLANMGNVAPAALELVDAETRRMVHEAEDTATKVLALNVTVLEDLANSLLRAETLSGPSLDVYMAAVKPWPEPLVKESGAHADPVRLRKEADAASGNGGGHFDEDAQKTWERGRER